MKRFATSIIIGVMAVPAILSPAVGDTASEVIAKIRTTMMSVASFTVSTTGPKSSSGIWVVHQARKRASYHVESAALSMDIVRTATMQYARVNNSEWRAFKVADDAFASGSMFVPWDTVTLTDDVVEGGVVLGTFSAEHKLAQIGDTIKFSCRYEKVTYRMRQCSQHLNNSPESQVTVFGKYDDGTNVVSLPNPLPTPGPGPTLPPWQAWDDPQ